MARSTKKEETLRTEVITSTSQLAPRKLDITVMLEDDIALKFQMKSLSYSQWYKYEREIPYPPAPILMAGPGGTSYDLKNPDYIKAIEDVNTKRTMLRLLDCFELETVGVTPEEKVQDLLSRDKRILLSLVKAVLDAHDERNARVETRAATFQGTG